MNDLMSKHKELLQDKFFLFFSYLLLLINHIPVQPVSYTHLDVYKRQQHLQEEFEQAMTIISY